MIEIPTSLEQLEATRHNAEAPYRIVEAISRDAGLTERANEVSEWAIRAGERVVLAEIASSLGLDTESLFTRSKPGLVEETLIGVFSSEGRPWQPVLPINQIGDFGGFRGFEDFGGDPVYHPASHHLYDREVEVGKEILTMIGATQPRERTAATHRRQTGHFDGADYQTPFGAIRVFNFRFYNSDRRSIDIFKLPDTAIYPEQQQKLL